MRNKKLLSTVVASALVATTMAVPVMAADGDTIDVDVATKTAVIKVAVPTAMSIAVDQFEMVDQGTQIYSEEFTMQNNSAIDVKVGITSTADLKSTTKLVATKAEAASDDAATGEAWMAVAAQTAAGSYNDGTATALKDLSEENANVTTFVQGTEADAAKGVAEQTYYLAKATAPVPYKLLNAGESAADIAYAQFYELTAETVGDADALAALLKAGDVYVATAAAANGQALTFVAKGGTHTYAGSEKYYTAAATATAKASIDASKLYVYADGTADAAKGTAAFRYIGNLSGAQETWSDDDITDVHIKYDIVGVTQTGYEKVENDCTYGLYKAPAPAVTTVTGTKITNPAGTTEYNGTTLAERIKSGSLLFQFDTTTNDVSGLSVTKILVDGQEYQFTVAENAKYDIATSDDQLYTLSGFTANSVSSVEVYYGESIVVEYTLN